MTDLIDHIDPKRLTLWVTDAEVIRRSGIPDKAARRLIRALDANPMSGFPKKNKVCADRRYWPDVMDYFAKMAASQTKRRA